MANGDGANELLSDIGKDLRLTHIVALITTMAVMIIDIGFIAVYLVAGRTINDYTIMVLGTDTMIALAVFLWVQGIISGNYISGAASLGQASMIGGPTQVPTAGVTAQGVVFQGLSANDLAALNSLIAQGKIPSTMIPLLATMTPQQIQALIALYSSVPK
ncbi:MAG: hypothetical protein ACP5RZ_05985 [Thermoplasmata archaeon]